MAKAIKIKDSEREAAIQQITEGFGEKYITEKNIENTVRGMRKAARKAKKTTTTNPTRLGIWTHPSTGQVRVYVNDDAIPAGFKVYYREDKDFGLMIEVTKSDSAYQWTSKDDVSLTAESLVRAMFNGNHPTWAQLIAAAK